MSKMNEYYSKKYYDIIMSDQFIESIMYAEGPPDNRKYDPALTSVSIPSNVNPSNVECSATINETKISTTLNVNKSVNPPLPLVSQELKSSVVHSTNKSLYDNTNNLDRNTLEDNNCILITNNYNDKFCENVNLLLSGNEADSSII